MSIGLNDVFKFGKHKGKTFSELMLTSDGPGYCAWLRAEKKKDKGITGFSKEANDVIDEAIRSSKTLRKKYAIENMNATDMQQAAVAAAERVVEEEKQEEERKVAYSEDWGAW